MTPTLNMEIYMHKLYLPDVKNSINQSLFINYYAIFIGEKAAILSSPHSVMLIMISFGELLPLVFEYGY